MFLYKAHFSECHLVPSHPGSLQPDEERGASGPQGPLSLRLPVTAPCQKNEPEFGNRFDLSLDLYLTSGETSGKGRGLPELLFLHLQKGHRRIRLAGPV